MLTVGIANIGDFAIVECKGRIVRSEAAFKLRKAVTSQQNVRTVVLDLTQVQAIEGGGLGMLWFLQRWAHDRGVQLKVFNPATSVKKRLEDENSMPRLEIATYEEMVALLGEAEGQYARAA